MASSLMACIAAACGLLALNVRATPAPSSGSGSSGNPILSLGDGGELSLRFASGVQVDDNIFLREAPTGDALFTFTPSTRIAFGKNANTNGTLALAHEFSAYAKERHLDTDLFSGEFAGSFEDGENKLGAWASFVESNRPTVELRGLVPRTTASLRGRGERAISELVSFAAEVHGIRTDYHRSGYGDADEVMIPVEMYYRWTPKIDLSFGYRQREFETEMGRDSTDRFFSVGVRGEMTPKLQGFAKAGVTSRRLERGGGNATLGMSAELSYLAGFADLFVVAERDAGTSPQGLQQRHTAVGVGAATRIGEAITARATVNYRRIEYFSWNDNFFEIEVGPGYRWNQYITLSASYGWRHNVSALRSSRFTSNALRFSADLRM